MQHGPQSVITRVGWTLALSTALALTAHAAANEKEYAKRQNEVVGADELMSADVSNARNPIGSVTELVLDADTTALEYILYDVSYPYGLYAEGERGFTTVDAVDFTLTSSHDINVRFTGELSGRAPEELEVTASEADHRLVSNLLGEHMQFADGNARRVTDILFDRDTGAIAYFVVEMEVDSLFDLDRRSIPADIVSIDDSGKISADTDIQGVDEITQPYDEELL